MNDETLREMFKVLQAQIGRMHAEAVAWQRVVRHVFIEMGVDPEKLKEAHRLALAEMAAGSEEALGPEMAALVFGKAIGETDLDAGAPPASP